MLRLSLTSITQSLINLVDDDFGDGDYGEDEARILSASSVSKNATGVDYLTFGAKKAINFLQYAFT